MKIRGKRYYLIIRLLSLADDDVVVHDVHGSCHQTKGSQSTRSRISLWSDVPRTIGDPGLHHGIWYDGEDSLEFLLWHYHFSCVKLSKCVCIVYLSSKKYS